MAGDAHVDDAHLKGMSKIFNGETIKGRANVSDDSPTPPSSAWGN